MVYLIIEHNFDSMENHNQAYEQIKGYVETLELAEKLVNEFNQSETFIDSNGETYPKYKNNYSNLYYEGFYPYLTYKKIEKINQ